MRTARNIGIMSPNIEELHKIYKHKELKKIRNLNRIFV
jgi:hypothetical protein